MPATTVEQDRTSYAESLEKANRERWLEVCREQAEFRRGRADEYDALVREFYARGDRTGAGLMRAMARDHRDSQRWYEEQIARNEGQVRP